MAQKKSEIKQISKQNVTINFGKAIRRKGGRRKRAQKPKGSSLVGGFVAPIINFPPNYVNPSAVQPLQQPQALLVPQRQPVAAPPPAVFNEGENLLGLPATNPTQMNIPAAEPLVPVPPFQVDQPEIFQPEAMITELMTTAPGETKEPENTINGRDTNLGEAYEPAVSSKFSFKKFAIPSKEQPIIPLQEQPTRSVSFESSESVSEKRRGRPSLYFNPEQQKLAAAETRALKKALKKRVPSAEDITFYGSEPEAKYENLLERVRK